MNVWRVETLWWRIVAVIGLAFGAFALTLAGWSIADFYFHSAMPWPAVGLIAAGVGGVLLLWLRMVRSGRNGLIWAAHWLVGWFYLLPIAFPLLALIVFPLLLPIAVSQIMVGYGAWRDSKQSESASASRPFDLPMTAVRVLTSIAVLVIFLAGFRVEGLAWPSHRTCLWEISRASSVRFPKSARLVNGYANFEWGSMLLAKVEMNRADVAGLVRSLPPSWGKMSRDPRDLFIGNGPGRDYVYPKWFTPTSQKCEVFHPGVQLWDATNVLVTLDDPKRATVYVYCYED